MKIYVLPLSLFFFFKAVTGYNYQKVTQFFVKILGLWSQCLCFRFHETINLGINGQLSNRTLYHFCSRTNYFFITPGTLHKLLSLSKFSYTWTILSRSSGCRLQVSQNIFHIIYHWILSPYYDLLYVMR